MLLGQFWTPVHTCTCTAGISVWLEPSTLVCTCSCCRWDVPGASWQRGTVPYEQRRGSGWAQSPTGLRVRLSLPRRYSPSRPADPVFPRRELRTGRRPAGWWSPDWRWPQTFGRRRWVWTLAAVRRDKTRRDEDMCTIKGSLMVTKKIFFFFHWLTGWNESKHKEYNPMVPCCHKQVYSCCLRPAYLQDHWCLPRNTWSSAASVTAFCSCGAVRWTL